VIPTSSHLSCSCSPALRPGLERQHAAARGEARLRQRVSDPTDLPRWSTTAFRDFSPASALGVGGGGVGLAAAGVAALAMAPPWLPASPVIAAAGLIVSGLVLLVFSRAMPRRTWKGARSLVHVRGFQEFLERAEKDRLARMPSDTLHRWLPWAIALGVSERWIWAFDGLAVEPPPGTAVPNASRSGTMTPRSGASASAWSRPSSPRGAPEPRARGAAGSPAARRAGAVAAEVAARSDPGGGSGIIRA
jgi:hypothetical protein